jgi:hypothetical protein
MKRMLMPIPTRIPISNLIARQKTKVPIHGIRSISAIKINLKHLISVALKASILLLLNMGLTTLTSTMKITAAMMRAPSAVLGMYWKKGVKKRRDKMTKTPNKKKLRVN